MLELFPPLASFYALIFLLMPMSWLWLAVTLVLIAVFAVMIISNKEQLSDCKNNESCYFVVGTFVAIYLGFSFYNRWLYSYRAQMLAEALHISLEMMLVTVSVILSVLAVYSISVAIIILAKKMSAIISKVSLSELAKKIICCMVASVTTVILAQFLAESKAFSMGCLNFLFGVLIITTLVLLLFGIFGNFIYSIIIGASSFMIIATINFYVSRFRGRLFEPVDIFSAVTAMNVAKYYSFFPIHHKLLVCWGVFIAVLIFICCVNYEVKSSVTMRSLFIFVSIISAVAISIYAKNLKTYHWYREGAEFNGYVLNFITGFKEVSAPKPKHYSEALMDKLAEEYASNNAQEKERSDCPHIIVIMDEAFSDLSVLGDFSTNKEVMPFISSLKENTVSGYALVSVYGGNTANSEYEFLTGNSLAWLSPNVVPYQQYIRASTYSMVSYLKSTYDYNCVAMHPYHASGWNRPTAYGYLEFDKCYFMQDFPQKKLVRDYVSDQEMFEFLIKMYEEEKENPLFVFGVTMQNHASYIYSGKNYTKHISINADGDDYSDVEQYLSLIHETDKAVEYLIDYFQNVDDNVIIVFYGDHQPKLSESFYENIADTPEKTLDEQQKRYEVPFFIWANYDIEEQRIDCTSLSYLSSYVYKAAGIELPPYNKFLCELEKVIPAINANGFFSPTAGCFLPIEEAEGDEQQWLELYEILQYNNLFDKRHKNEKFFPTLDLIETN